MRGASVASILLGLGALCLLVAAVIFLAVAWSWLGVGGRTVVLVALTITAATLGTWLSRRGLRLAAESLTLVSLGLLALDALGAENAGWLGQLSTAGTVSLVGATLLAGALALLLVSRLVTPQVVSVIGLWTLVAGVSGQTAHDQVVLVLGVLAFACLAEVGRLRGVTALPWLALVGAGTWWAALLLVALSDAADHATVRAMWAQGHGVGLLAASALLLLPIPFSAARSRVRRACAAAAATLATVALALPGMDDGATTVAWVSLVLLLLWSGAALVLGERWKAVALAPMALSAVPVTVIAAYLLVEAAANTLAVGDPFTRTAGVRLPSLSLDAEPALSVPCVVGLLVAAAVATSVATSVTTSAGRRVVVPGAASVVALAAIATLALHTVPLWTVTAATSLVAAALVADAVRRTDRAGSVEAAGGGLVAILAIAFALPSALLCTVATAVLVLAAAAVAVTGRFLDARVAAWTVLPAATAGLIWSGAEVAAVDTAYRAAPILIVVGLMAILRPRIEVEVSAAVASLVASAAAVPAATDPTWSLSLHLTLAGALVTASALVTPSRRSLGWLGGALLAAATWVRLAEIGVHAPEAYTLPSAVALLLVGLHRLRHDPDAATMTALAPGLVLATVPSLLWVVAGDAVSLRAALLGLGCLALVLVGARLRWNAPLLVGSSVGALLVLRELAPYAGHTPQWVLIGFAGTVLTLVGITWENRMLELRHAAAYLGRLR
ncbi:SCO7613 C-terminal domain-containing membrane protein [Nocardioides ungokensis]